MVKYKHLHFEAERKVTKIRNILFLPDFIFKEIHKMNSLTYIVNKCIDRISLRENCPYLEIV